MLRDIGVWRKGLFGNSGSETQAGTSSGRFRMGREPLTRSEAGEAGEYPAPIGSVDRYAPRSATRACLRTNRGFRRPEISTAC